MTRTRSPIRSPIRSPALIPLLLWAVLTPAASMAESDPGGVEVTGQGTIEVAADQATIAFLARSEHASGSVAYGQTQQLARRLIETARKHGVGADDLEASGVALGPEYVPPETQRTPRFVATATVTTVVRKLDGVDELMDAMVAAGALVNGAPLPGLEDPDAVRDQAIERAVADARRQAEQVARLLGVRLGSPRRIVVHDSGGQPYPMARMAMDSAETSTFVPGKIPVTQSVNVVFEIMK